MQILSLGTGPASGNLAVCEVLRFHVAADILQNGTIAPDSIDLVGRNSANFYTRASGAAIFEIEKPTGQTGIGYDALPKFIRESHELSANNLAQLANCDSMPTNDDVAEFTAQHSGAVDEQAAVKALSNNDPGLAWLILSALAIESAAKQ